MSVVENCDARAWDAFVASRGGHLFQSAAWGELKSRFGWQAYRLALERGRTCIAGAQILFRHFPLGLVFGYIPRGPVVDFDDAETSAALFDAIYTATIARHTFVLKVEPNLTCALGAGQRTMGGVALDPSHSIQPRTTIHVDLKPDLDSILAGMKPKWRYNIRLAERKGVSVREGLATDLAIFYALMQTTGKRDRFAIHSSEYYKAAFELFAARNHARLFIAEYERQPLAAIVVSAFGGEAIYLYGASSNEHRERMPNHALHWAAIQWAKARGCERYDLWGVAAVTDSLAKDGSALPHGLYQFKQGFGGRLVQYGGAYDAVFSRWRNTLFTSATSLRRAGLG